MCCFKILDWHAHRAHWQKWGKPPLHPHHYPQPLFILPYPCKSEKTGLWWMGFFSAASYLILVWFWPSAAASAIVPRRLYRKNTIRVNNCELSCHILLVVFDVLDVIKSVSSASSVSLHPVSVSNVPQAWHGVMSLLIRLIVSAVVYRCSKNKRICVGFHILPRFLLCVGFEVIRLKCWNFTSSFFLLSSVIFWRLYSGVWKLRKREVEWGNGNDNEHISCSVEADCTNDFFLSSTCMWLTLLDG